MGMENISLHSFKMKIAKEKCCCVSGVNQICSNIFMNIFRRLNFPPYTLCNPLIKRFLRFSPYLLCCIKIKSAANPTTNDGNQLP